MGPSGVGFGVYVHIPFCAHRCDYCDFATWTDRAHLIDDYVDACVADVERRSARGDVPLASSAFFGGGTPSMVPAAQLARIVDVIPRRAGAEVTVECNPDSIDLDALRTLRSAGVNRISIGVQSMVAPVLVALGRTHDPDNVVRAVDAVRTAGIERLNLDLIYGAVGETADDWRSTVERAIALEPEHVSAYALTVEAGTRLGLDIASGARRAPDDDDQADKYVIADEMLGAAGYEWYEISNWAKPNEACRHNELYWHGDDYLAIGCAAHGKTGDRRWWNVRTPERYIEALRTGGSPEAGCEELHPDVRARERLALELRTKQGVAVTDCHPAAAEEMQSAGLVAILDGRIVLTRSGRLLANEVILRLE